MQFASVSLSDALGAILAHSVRAGDLLLRKGRVLSESDLANLARRSIEHVTVARLDLDDIGEDEAAARIAGLSAGAGVRVGAAFTGRANLFAGTAGLAVIDAPRVAALNACHEAITMATLAPFARVGPRQMLATVKIIPFGAPREAVERIELLLAPEPLLRVAPFRPCRAALISTSIGEPQAKLLDKNAAAIAARLVSLGSALAFERRVAHQTQAVALALREAVASGADPILVFGASAITDRRDVVPAALAGIGGTIERFGMPVDPGNLLLLGRLDGTTVIGLPGCARSSKRNGFDFVLERVLAGLTISAADIAAIGVGGLLMEIPTRPQLRDPARRDVPHAPRIAAIVLAAGLASRMGQNKLAVEIKGKPLLRHIVEAACASHASPVMIVTGNAAEEARGVLEGLEVTFVHNPEFLAGLSASLKAGIRAVPEDCDGAMVLLGDMPAVETALIDKLIAAFNPEEGRAICVASHRGKRGNPVLWARQFFGDMLALQGDVGAKHLIAANEEAVCDVEAGSDAPLIDIDTPEALANYRRPAMP